jgi:hypothetical protein
MVVVARGPGGRPVTSVSRLREGGGGGDGGGGGGGEVRAIV